MTTEALLAEIRKLANDRDVLLAAAKLGLARIESDVEGYGRKAPDGEAIRAAIRQVEGKKAGDDFLE